MRSKIISFISFAVLFCGVIWTSEAVAQTSKKKKKAVTTSTPIPIQTVPVVISRADEFPNDDQVIVTENPQNRTQNSEDRETAGMDELEARIKLLESSKKNDYDTKQKRLLLNLDILTRAEQRAESLRKQLFEMIEKENTIQIRIEQLNYDLQPAMIERYAAIAGSLRPEQIRDARKRSLESEKRNLENLMSQIALSRKSLEDNVFKSDSLVEKLRSKLEKDIDEALVEKEDNQ